MIKVISFYSISAYPEFYFIPFTTPVYRPNLREYIRDYLFKAHFSMLHICYVTLTRLWQKGKKTRTCFTLKNIYVILFYFKKHKKETENIVS